MTTYKVTRHDASVMDCRVFEDEKAPYQLPHIPVHSPSGFNAGYLGSGPADLAVSILAHYFGEFPQQVLDAWGGSGESRALVMHQQFKRDIVASILLADGESYGLTSEQVGHWLAEGL